MSKEKILTELESIFRDVFKDPELTIEEHTSNADIDEWDSLNHAVLIAAIERQYGLRFELMEMLAMQTAGDIRNQILARQQ